MRSSASMRSVRSTSATIWKCSTRFPDDFFDWVYLDTTHEYGHTRDELEILRTKVKPSGVIAGDDWHEDPAHLHHGVCRAVREFCDRYGWELRNRRLIRPVARCPR